MQLPRECSYKFSILVKKRANYKCEVCGSMELVQAHAPNGDHSDWEKGIALCAGHHADEHPKIPRRFFFAHHKGIRHIRRHIYIKPVKPNLHLARLRARLTLLLSKPREGAGGMLLSALIKKQLNQELTDSEFAHKLGISRSMWQFTARGEQEIGWLITLAVVKKFPDLFPELLFYLRDYQRSSVDLTLYEKSMESAPEQ